MEQPEVTQESAEEVPQEEAPTQIETKEEPKDKSQAELDRALKKLSRYKHEKANLSKQLQELQETNQKLAEMFSKADAAAMDNYDKKVELQLEKAKKMQLAAIEAGDVEQQAEASMELAKAAAEMQQVQMYKAQQAQRQTPQPIQPQTYPAASPDAQPSPTLNNEAIRWLHNNSWCDESSEEYDESMAEEVKAYDAVLARRYQRMGMVDKIASPQYFQELDSYVRTNIMGEPAPNKPTQVPFNKVSPVTPKSFTNLSVNNLKLNDTQKELASRLGVSEEAFKQSLLERILENRKRGR